MQISKARRIVGDAIMEIRDAGSMQYSIPVIAEMEDDYFDVSMAISSFAEKLGLSMQEEDQLAKLQATEELPEAREALVRNLKETLDAMDMIKARASEKPVLKSGGATTLDLDDDMNKNVEEAKGLAYEVERCWAVQFEVRLPKLVGKAK